MSAAITIALAGDLMLGRLVGERIARAGSGAVWGDLLPELRSADLLLANLECALTSRRERWRDGHVKAFYFGASPTAVEALRLAGVDFVALANNHILDFREDGMRETIATIERAGIAHAGAGNDLAQASRPARLTAGGVRVSVIACADHPAEWAATERSAGVNFISVQSSKDLDSLRAAIGAARRDADLVILSLHWGSNMRLRPSLGFRELATAALSAGADVVWGHSAHVLQGVEIRDGKPILYDTGELLDDYAVDEELRNDLGAIFELRIVDHHIDEIEVVPIGIDDMRTSLASGPDRAWLLRRLGELCGELGTEIVVVGGRALVRPRTSAPVTGG